MLILFDIDGTLLNSHGAGFRAVWEAGRELFGRELEHRGKNFAGQLDSKIFHELCALNGIDDPELHQPRFRALYTERLRRVLDDGHRVEVLPGVQELLAALAAHSEVTLGILSGNYPETGQLKIEAAGIDFGCFTLGAWGHDASERRELPPIAMRRYADLSRRELAAHQVVIVGDTRWDVDCALANGCRCLAVATGPATLPELEALGAHWVFEDLEATAAILTGLGLEDPAG